MSQAPDEIQEWIEFAYDAHIKVIGPSPGIKGVPDRKNAARNMREEMIDEGKSPLGIIKKDELTRGIETTEGINPQGKRQEE